MLRVRTTLLAACLLTAFVPVHAETDLDARYDAAIDRLLDPDANIEAEVEQATQLRMERDDLSAPVARIGVDRDAAAHLAAAGKYLEASTYLNHAITLARSLADAVLLLDLYHERIAILQEARDRARVIETARLAIALATRLDRTADRVDFGCILAQALQEAGRIDAVSALLDELQTLPEADRFQIAYTRARLLDRTGGSGAARERWQQVLALADPATDLPLIARAHDHLAYLARLEDRIDDAADHFARADALAPDRRRPSFMWEAQAHVRMQRHDEAGAISALQNAMTGADDLERATLHEALASLFADRGDLAATRRHFEAALVLRKSGAITQRLPSVRMTPSVSADQTSQAADLAAARAALREADLDRSRLLQRQTLGITTVITLIAALLGLAYAYKRRAAANAELAKDSAELRAENAQLLALRYQLNPHFLFNALNSLRSRVFSNQAEAERLIDRLTAFCRRTLEHRADGIETLGEEYDLLEAYLQIEQSRWRENLALTLDFDPAARPRRFPTLLLLPLIENALKYGAQTSEERIVIAISIQATAADTLTVTVTNSGRWIKPGTARRRTSTRTGVANVQDRLRHYYPGRHTFDLGPSAAGVTARLTLTGNPATTAV